MFVDKRYLKILAVVFVSAVLMLPLTGCGKSKSIESGSTWEIAETTKLSSLNIADIAAIKAPEGHIVTLTVDGVETGQVLETWEGVNYKFAPGNYKGNIVLTVAEANVAAGRSGGRGGAAGGRMSGGAEGGAQGGAPRGTGAAGGPGGNERGGTRGGMSGGADRGAAQGGAPGGTGLNSVPAGAAGTPNPRSSAAYSYRQALYLDAKGINNGKSVLAAVKGEKPTGFDIHDIEINSKGTFYKDETSPGGTSFNGIYAVGGEYNLKNVKINFFGDGRSDFTGYGSAIVASGKGTKLVFDNLTINNEGVVRAGVIAKDGSKVIVKNSNIQCKGGVLPPGWLSPMNPSVMRSTLWISGMSGNVRATSVLGAETEAAYINSSVSSDGWGVFSTDQTTNIHLNVINCKANITGEEGYGNYNDPSAHVAYYGTEMNMATFASVIGSGDVYYGDSTPEVVKGLNEKFGLGLTAEELQSIPAKSTVINSKKFGVMWHRTGNPLTVDGGTTFNTAKTTFIVSGVPAVINMDGSKGAKINPGNGVIMQVASDDQPADMSSTGSYEEPTTEPKPIKGFDNTSADGAATANFSNIDLKGDFYNSVGWGKLSDKLNMAINLDKSSVTGVISASTSHHSTPKITKDNFREFHSITDAVRPAVNNGVIVNLTNGSKWIITGTSYITNLSIGDGCSVAAPEGFKLNLMVNGLKKEIKAGKYSGKITLAVTKE